MKFEKQDGIMNYKKSQIDNLNQNTVHKNYTEDIISDIDLNSIIQLDKTQFILKSYLNRPNSNIFNEQDCKKSSSLLKNVMEDDYNNNSKQFNDLNKNGYIEKHLKMNSLGEQTIIASNYCSINNIETLKNPLFNQTLHKSHHSCLSNIPMRMRKFPASFFNGDSNSNWNNDDKNIHILDNLNHNNTDFIKNNKSSMEKFTKHSRFNSSPLNHSDKSIHNGQLEHCSSLQSLFSTTATTNSNPIANGADLYKINSTNTLYKNRAVAIRNDHDKSNTLSKCYMNKKKYSKRCLSVDTPVSTNDLNFEFTFDYILRNSISATQIESTQKLIGEGLSSQIRYESSIGLNKFNDSINAINSSTNTSNNNRNNILTMANQNLNLSNLPSTSISNFTKNNVIHSTSSIINDASIPIDHLTTKTNDKMIQQQTKQHINHPHFETQHLKNDRTYDYDFTKISDQFDNLFYSADFKDFQLETNEYQSALVQAMVDNAVEVLNEMESQKNI